MRKFFKILFFLILVALFGWTAKYLYAKSKKKVEIYNTEKAYIGTIIQKTVATGSIVPKKEIEIKPQLSGIIDELYVKPGQKIKKGDLIAKIRVIPSMTSLNSAETRVNRAKIAQKKCTKKLQQELSSLQTRSYFNTRVRKL